MAQQKQTQKEQDMNQLLKVRRDKLKESCRKAERIRLSSRNMT